MGPLFVSSVSSVSIVSSESTEPTVAAFPAVSDGYGAAGFYLAADDFFGQRVFYVALDGAFERAGAVFGIISNLSNIFLYFFAQP